MKTASFVVKICLVSIGFILCILKWTGIMPGADIHEIWYCVGFAYGVGLGTVDFNITRDNWIEKKTVNKETEKNTEKEAEHD